MALVRCKECGRDISSTAKNCPQCGAAPPKKPSVIKLLGVGLVGFMAYKCVAPFTDSPTAANSAPPPRVKSAEEGMADKNLNVAVAAAKALKAGMKDPRSFELESFFIFPDGITCFEYRGKNSFGATVPGKAIFIPPARLMTMDVDRKAFVTAWNRDCTRPGGVERARGLNQLGAI